jgi:hypothetical protein
MVIDSSGASQDFGTDFCTQAVPFQSRNSMSERMISPVLVTVTLK